jgi:rhodanese-related sulfurtransferase
MQNLSPADLALRLTQPETPAPLLLDVREPWEFATCHIAGSQPMPMASVPARIEELDPEAEIVVVCHHGMRSAQVCMFLERQGFSRVFNLAGGVAAWAAEVDPSMPQY